MIATEISEGSVRVLAGLFEARTGQQLASGRRWRVEMALRSLVDRYRAGSLDELVGRIVAGRDPGLADAVIEALLNHETFFFRDIASFQLLAGPGFERLRVAREGVRRLRIWSAGCSTGQECYTIAMLFAEQPARWAGWSIEILGTDLSPEAIVRARAARYNQLEVQRGLPVRHMLRAFDQCGDQWHVRAAIRERVTFRVHNLLDPPPPGPFDVVLCRNVLYYLAPDVRRMVFARLSGAMAPDGVLMLGAGEAAMGQTDRFVSDYECRGLYRPRVDAAAGRPPQAANFA